MLLDHFNRQNHIDVTVAAVLDLEWVSSDRIDLDTKEQVALGAFAPI